MLIKITSIMTLLFSEIMVRMGSGRAPQQKDLYFLWVFPTYPPLVLLTGVLITRVRTRRCLRVEVSMRCFHEFFLLFRPGHSHRMAQGNLACPLPIHGLTFRCQMCRWGNMSKHRFPSEGILRKSGLHPLQIAFGVMQRDLCLAFPQGSACGWA